MKVIFTLLFILSFNLQASNILFIGDSHTAGPFGKNVHNILKKHHNIVTLGHSSSAPIHWIGDKVFHFSGGIFNAMAFNGKGYSHPNQPDWRVKSPTPKLAPLLVDLALHSNWESGHKPEVIVVALGANDARALSDEEGNINSHHYKKREKALLSLLNMIQDKKCIWIAPPSGRKKTEANQLVLYEFLEKNIRGKCSFMSSNHFYVNGCDGVHMNCPSEYENARKWAMEVSDFIQGQL